MSLQNVVTELEGYEQVSTVAAFPLSRAYNSRPYLDRIALRNMVDGIPGVVKIQKAKTMDGYRWFSGIYFSSSEKEIAVLFPWASDPQRKDNAGLDRLIGIYSKGSPDLSKVNDLLSELTKRLVTGRI